MYGRKRKKRSLRFEKKKKMHIGNHKEKSYKKIRQKRNQNSKRKYTQKTCRSLPLSQKMVDKILQKRATNAELTSDFTEEGVLCFYSTLTDKKKASFLNSN